MFGAEPDESGFDIEFEHKRKALYIYGLLQPTRPEIGLGRSTQFFFFETYIPTIQYTYTPQLTMQ